MYRHRPPPSGDRQNGRAVSSHSHPEASPYLALPRGANPGIRRGSLARAHEDFLSTGSLNTSLRKIVADSWKLSRDSGVNPDQVLPPVDLTDEELEAYRSAHPLAAMMPLIRRLLVEEAEGTNAIVAVADADARLLWVEGDAGLVRRAERMHWVPGARWDEVHAGTNAPATALRLDRALQFFSREHFAGNVASWSCAAAPIHDPTTGRLLGVLDVTGRDEVAAPAVLDLIRAAVTAVESELRFAELARGNGQLLRPAGLAHPRPTPPRPAELKVLGQDRAVLVLDGVTSRMSLRHSELLLLLARRSRGYSADQLAIALHEEDIAPVTVRAEMSRLRQLAGGLKIEGRPYRLGEALTTDVQGVRDLLAAGDVARAVGLYAGPVLPASESPQVAVIRDELHLDLRTAVLACKEFDPVFAFARADFSHGDLPAWMHALHLAGPSARPMISDRIRDLQAEFG